MNILSDLPRIGTVSWFRAYHAGEFATLLPGELFRRASGIGLELLDADAHAFYDIQALRRGHVARAVLPPVRLETDLAPVTQAYRRTGAGVPCRVTAEVVPHLLAHASGFVVIRPTISFETIAVDGAWGPEVLHGLERVLWWKDMIVRWYLPGGNTPLEGNARVFMNWIFFNLFTRWGGRPADPASLSEWAGEGIQGCERLHQLHAEGRLGYPFPCSFGTQLELVDPALAGNTAAHDRGDVEDRAAEVASVVLRQPMSLLTALPNDVEQGSHQVWWYVEENQVLMLQPYGDVDPELGVVDCDRTQLIELLALRRGALRSVERDTQRVLTERRTISRREVEGWHHVVATTTDDYVLHDRIGCLTEGIKRHFAQDPQLRDVGDLEAQVRANLAWFQERMDATAAWTGGLVGALVGAGALVLSLGEVVRLTLATVAGVPVEDVGDRYGLVLAGLLFVLVVVSFGLGFVTIRHLSDHLRPLSRKPFGS